eukprot:4141539-Alexandrium_andersonii.AAC.1
MSSTSRGGGIVTGSVVAVARMWGGGWSGASRVWACPEFGVRAGVMLRSRLVVDVGKWVECGVGISAGAGRSSGIRLGAFLRRVLSSGDWIRPR